MFSSHAYYAFEVHLLFSNYAKNFLYTIKISLLIILKQTQAEKALVLLSIYRNVTELTGSHWLQRLALIMPHKCACGSLLHV